MRECELRAVSRTGAGPAHGDERRWEKLIEVGGPHLGPLPAIPGAPDRRPGPARAEAAAIVASVIKSGPAEIVLVVAVPIGRRVVGQAPGGSPLAKNRNGFVARLTVAGQEAIAMPAGGLPLFR